ncbi:TetR/AcrR family transcriptional regulator [Phyllobacterium sp. 22229]|uniref:TetR/AcrR family transcriptional regulator n=1 Tax=Agrobacterium radiobacter TaxID=362 RepID=A0ABD5LP61_AGRRD
MTEETLHLTGRPTKAQMLQITDAVLDAACDFFSAKGFAGASMDEIADRAGITKRTIYRRYPSKHALLDAVVEREILRFHQWLNGAEPGQTAIEKLKNTAFRLFEYNTCSQNTRFANFLSAEGSFSEDLREKVIEWEDVALAPVISLIADAQKKKYLPATDTSELGYLLLDLINGGRQIRNFDRLMKGSTATRKQFFDYRWKIFLNSTSS